MHNTGIISETLMGKRMERLFIGQECKQILILS